MEKFAKARAAYSTFELRKIEGNRFKKGSSILESNHQSVLSFLNDGLKGTNYYFETPAMLMRDLLARQNKHIKIINGLLHGMNQRMDVTIAGLMREEQTEHAVELLSAARNLIEQEYKTYASNKEIARTTLMVEHLFDGNQQPFFG